MADNTAQTGTDTIATDDVTTLNGAASSGVKVQRVKVQYGDDGSARDVSTAFPLPTVQINADGVAAGTISAADTVAGIPSQTGGFVTGTPTANSTVSLALGLGDSSWVVQLTGTLGGGTFYFEGSQDSTNGSDGNWFLLSSRQAGMATGPSTAFSATTVGIYRGASGALGYIRVRCVGGSGISAGVRIRSGDGTGTVFLDGSLPGGQNTLGNVGILSASPTLTTGQLTSAAAPPTPNTTSTASTVVANVSTAGNVTVYLVGGTYTALTLAFEISYDGTNWFAINVSRSDGTGVDLNPSFTAATVRAWETIMPGATYFRVRATAYTATTGPTVVIAPGGFAYDPAPTVTLPFAQPSPAVSNGAALGMTAPAAGGTFTAYLTGTAVQAAAALVNAPAAGLSLYVTDVIVGNSGSALTVISLLEGTTTTRFAFPAAASGGGGPVNLKTPWKLPAATALGIAVSVATTTWYATVCGYVAP